jgi:hypothetical protein
MQSVWISDNAIINCSYEFQEYNKPDYQTFYPCLVT